MEQNEIREGNNIIAEFMSDEPEWAFMYEKDNYRFYRNPWSEQYPSYDENLKVNGSEYLPTCNFKFNCSWDWLMPVIKKIECIGEDDYYSKENYHLFIGKRYTRVIYDWDGYRISDEGYADEEMFKRFLNSSKDYRHVIFDNNKIYSTWTAVVDFIKWKNQNK